MAEDTVRQECDERAGEYRENEAGEDHDPLQHPRLYAQAEWRGIEQDYVMLGPAKDCRLDGSSTRNDCKRVNYRIRVESICTLDAVAHRGHQRSAAYQKQSIRFGLYLPASGGYSVEPRPRQR